MGCSLVVLRDLGCVIPDHRWGSIGYRFKPCFQSTHFHVSALICISVGKILELKLYFITFPISANEGTRQTEMN